jgi:hypothetical protein
MDQYRNSDILRGFSFNKVLVSQKFDIFRGFRGKIQAKLGHYPLRKSSFSGINIYSWEIFH